MTNTRDVIHLMGPAAMKRYEVVVPETGDQITSTPKGWWILNGRRNCAYGPFPIEALARKELASWLNDNDYTHTTIRVVRVYTH